MVYKPTYNWGGHPRPSGEPTFCYGKIHHFIAGKIHYFDWAMFNCMLVHQRVTDRFKMRGSFSERDQGDDRVTNLDVPRSGAPPFNGYH